MNDTVKTIAKCIKECYSLIKSLHFRQKILADENLKSKEIELEELKKEKGGTFDVRDPK